MAAKTNLTTTAQFSTSAREVDFVTRFDDNWTALRTILGIMRPIRKAPGTQLVSYKASVDGTLQGGTTVAEGDEIPFTKMKVEPVAYDDIAVAKYAKSVTIESVAKYGADVAVLSAVLHQGGRGEWYAHCWRAVCVKAVEHGRAVTTDPGCRRICDCAAGVQKGRI